MYIWKWFECWIVCCHDRKKVVKMVIFMVHGFYHNKKNDQKKYIPKAQGYQQRQTHFSAWFNAEVPTEIVTDCLLPPSFFTSHIHPFLYSLPKLSFLIERRAPSLDLQIYPPFNSPVISRHIFSVFLPDLLFAEAVL